MPDKGNITFNSEQFDRLFPFFILVDGDMKTVKLGRTLGKLCPTVTDRPFSDGFAVIVFLEIRLSGSIHERINHIEGQRGETD